MISEHFDLSIYTERPLTVFHGNPSKRINNIVFFFKIGSEVKGALFVCELALSTDIYLEITALSD